jgi:hypothetical protein
MVIIKKIQRGSLHKNAAVSAVQFHAKTGYINGKQSGQNVNYEAHV